MKYTNKHGLPRPVARALAADNYIHHGDFSMTELDKPPQMVQLCKRHDDKIVVEVMDNVWMVRGTALHYVNSLAAIKGAFIEERFIVTIDGIQISMQSDYVYPIEGLDRKYAILDHKDCTHHMFSHGLKPEHERQLNGYIYGWSTRGIDIAAAHIVMWFKDWSYTDAVIKKTYNYPPQPIIAVDVPIWQPSDILAWMRERIQLHQEAVELSDDELPACTLEDRWAKPDLFACVFSGGDSKGGTVPKGANFRTSAEANNFIAERRDKARLKKGGFKKGFVDATVEFRRSESIRCERYCSAKPFCHQYNTLIKKRPF